MLADGAGLQAEQMQAAHRHALVSAGMEDDPARILGFLRWRTPLYRQRLVLTLCLFEEGFPLLS